MATDFDFDLEEFADEYGNVRRCGSLIPATVPNLVCSFPPFVGAAESPLWTPEQIMRAIRGSKRAPSRVLFGPAWIQNQSKYGSCNGWALAGMLSRARWSRGLTDGKLFSGSYAYSLMNNNQDRGSVLEDGLRLLGSRGCCLAGTVNPDQIYRNQYNNQIADTEAANYKGIDCYRCLTLEAFDTALATRLYYGVAAVQAGKRYQTPNQHGICGADSGIGNHAIGIDDICEVAGTLVYDNPGTWGLSLGGKGNGRVYLTRDSFEQTFPHHWFYIIPCTVGI